MIRSCPSQNKLADIFQPSNKDLYAKLAQNPGPPMEQRPFPEFEVAACRDWYLVSPKRREPEVVPETRLEPDKKLDVIVCNNIC